MSEETFYKYRLFTHFTVFNVFSRIETKEELWKKIINTKNDKLEEELYHINKPGDERVGVVVRPSAIVAIDTPFGTDPVKISDDPEVDKVTQRAIPHPNRVVINSQPNSRNTNMSKSLHSRRKLKR